MAFDVAVIRQQFPILSRDIDGSPLVYLDNAATTHKPQCVIDAISHYYSYSNSNVHRGAHRLADESTKAYEGARDTVARFINANVREEVIWTSGTTESINIVAHGIAQQLNPGDQLLVTEMEHHADLVTWQQACATSGAELKVAPINDNGELNLDQFQTLLCDRTKLVAFPHISNALGTVNPITKMIAMAKAAGALVLIDGAQGIAHGDVDVQSLGCDFYVFSGHKVFAPTGTGVLWGRQSLLESWPVWQTGGEMISTVTYQSAQWNQLPYRLEAGTPHIAGVIGLGAALEWLSRQDLDGMRLHEKALMATATERAEQFEGLRIIGTAKNKLGVLSFLIEGGHPADVGFLLDRQGIAIRTGHHCAEPLMNRLGVPGTARASFSLYNTLDEVDALFDALKKVRLMLA
ncbi:aminotransferase class V-fold PLP-dependent enzyme [Marinibactrum halimedae]|uniref:Cysteine desulfurase n=1 Tax=Marinibactrum halimedae TaxID=1444977 RepID=A0AA37T2G3_9GAMM|nr:SufS family cysteine desulfurase [Marinibactrum halimedae]MCD9457733.1 SufS family cysteine desulfurase [Marinibactrum halimedae]GLS24894.1 cysteine desulfurase [Marinibactrum halimedae]